MNTQGEPGEFEIIEIACLQLKGFAPKYLGSL
jgi:hypothetical protein